MDKTGIIIITNDTTRDQLDQYIAMLELEKKTKDLHIIEESEIYKAIAEKLPESIKNTFKEMVDNMSVSIAQAQKLKTMLNNDQVENNDNYVKQCFDKIFNGDEDTDTKQR